MKLRNKPKKSLGLIKFTLNTIHIYQKNCILDLTWVLDLQHQGCLIYHFGCKKKNPILCPLYTKVPSELGVTYVWKMQKLAPTRE